MRAKDHDGHFLQLARFYNIGEALKRLDTYTEISPSATGIHCVAKGDLIPGFGNKNKELDYEIYKDARFLSFTGHVISATKTIEERQAAIGVFHTQHFRPRPVYKPIDNSTASTLSTSEIIQKLSNAKNSAKFTKLWVGDYSAYRGDESSADFAFCQMVGFYTQNAAQILHIIKISGLRRAKWDRADYAERTINRALAGLRKTYSPKRR